MPQELTAHHGSPHSLPSSLPPPSPSAVPYSPRAPPLCVGVPQWTLDSVDALQAALGVFLRASSSDCVGTTRLLSKPSESVGRVVASLMPPLEISHVETAGGRDLLYVNLMCAARLTARARSGRGWGRSDA